MRAVKEYTKSFYLRHDKSMVEGIKGLALAGKL